MSKDQDVDSKRAEADAQAPRAKIFRWSAAIIFFGLLLIFLQLALEAGLRAVSLVLVRNPEIQLRFSESFYIGLVVLIIGATLMGFAFLVSRPEKPVRPSEAQPSTEVSAAPVSSERSELNLVVSTPSGWIRDKGAFLDQMQAALKVAEWNWTIRIVEYAQHDFAASGGGHRVTIVELMLLAGCPLETRRQLRSAVVGVLTARGVPAADVRIVVIETAA